MKSEVILALIYKLVEDRVTEKLSSIEFQRGVRGMRGQRGSDGKDFSFEENKQNISGLINNHIDSIKDSLKLSFNDLTEEEILSLKGADGKEGKDGRDGVDGASFDFEESREDIERSIHNYISTISDELKLRFEDLSEEEISLLRGKKGKDGRDGRDFIFEENRESISELVSSFIEENKSTFKLKFEELKPEEKDQLKLKFEDLTEDERSSLRGARGQRGRAGADGQSIVGPMGPRGLPGAIGPRGYPGKDAVAIDGKDGVDGKDGADAPVVTDVRVDKWGKNEISFEFDFSNGETLVTNKVALPTPQVVSQSIINAGGDVAQNYTTEVDTTDPDVTYVGEAAIGSITSSPVWRIQKVEKVGTIISVTFADSNDGFDNVWDDRLSLTYG